jgi:hypothetical protein
MWLQRYPSSPCMPMSAHRQGATHLRVDPQNQGFGDYEDKSQWEVSGGCKSRVQSLDTYVGRKGCQGSIRREVSQRSPLTVFPNYAYISPGFIQPVIFLMQLHVPMSCRSSCT